MIQLNNMSRGALTIEQKEKQLIGIRSKKNRKRASNVMLQRWKVEDMTDRNKKISLSKLAEKHPLWKGNQVKYEALHQWIRNNFIPPKKCENCNKIKRLDAANISGKYLRERLDWKYLCRKCHMISDGRLQKIIDKKGKW